MRRTIKILVAGVIAATGLALTGNMAKAQPGNYRPYPPQTGPIRIQPQIPPPMPYPYPQPRPMPYPQPIPQRHDHDFVVYARCPIDGGWEFYGKYETYHQARDVQIVLARQGRPSKIDQVYGGRIR